MNLPSAQAVLVGLVFLTSGCSEPVQPIAVADGPEQIYVARSDGTLITWLAAGSSPSWSPDGTRIAFVNAVDGEIYSIDLNGTAPLRLTTNGGGLGNPRWSPDGSRIALDGISVVNADGTASTRLAHGTEPAWSPDGRRIAFTGRDGDGVEQVFVIEADGSKAWQLGGFAYVPTRSPAWSPDGSRIAFIAGPSGLLEEFAEVFTINADGSNLRQLTREGRALEAPPAWSPDGSRVAFANFLAGDWMIAAMRADGTAQTHLAGAAGGPPAWSPDGRAILFDTSAGVALVSSGGGDARVLIGRARGAAWSPDGTRVVFVSNRLE